MTIPFRSNQISGSLTRLVDGTSYLIAGDSITIETGSQGEVTISHVATSGDITSVVAGAGLEGGGTSGDVTLAIKSTVATLTSSNIFTLDNTFNANTYLSGNVSSFTATGSARFNAGLSGSLTHLVDGTSYLFAGNGISISTGSDGQVTITNDGTVGDITSVVAGAGLEGGGTSGDVTLGITSDIATLTGSNTFAGSNNIFSNGVRVNENISVTGTGSFESGISGSLTRLIDGTSYIVEGANITVATGSSGQITISAAAGATAAGSDRQIQFNDGGSNLGASANLVFDGGSSLRVTGSMQISSSLESGAHPLLKIDHENASNILFVSGSGKVGIGVADPDATLEVFSSTTQAKFSFDADSFATVTVEDDGVTTLASSTETVGGGDMILDAHGDIKLQADGGQVTLQRPGGSNRFIFDISTGDVFLTNIQDSDMIFRVGTGQTEVFRIDQSEDSIKMVTNSKIQFRDTATSIGSTAANTLQVIAPNFGLTGSLHISSSAEGDANPLLRIDHENATGGAPLFFVSGSGVVAIGTDSPRTDSNDTNRLHILGEGGADQGINPAVNSALVLENNDHVGMNIITPANKSGMIIFGDANVSNRAYFRYDHSSDKFFFDGTFGEEVMSIARAGDAVNIGSNNSGHMVTTEASLHISSSGEGTSTGGPVLLKIDHENASNILVVTGSGRVGIGTEEPSDKFTVFGNGSTDRVFFLSGSGGAGSENESSYPDINFFVSGSVGSKDTSTRGTALFGGDTVISGGLYVNETIFSAGDTDTKIVFSNDQIDFFAGNERLLKLDEAADDEVVVGDGGDVNFRVATKGFGFTLYVKSEHTAGAENAVAIRHQSPQEVFHVSGSTRIDSEGRENVLLITGTLETNSHQVLILSGGAPGSPNEEEYTDVAFFVSGTQDSKSSATVRGTALFGGDLAVSGTLHGGSSLKIGDITQFTVQNQDLGSGTSSTITPVAPLIFLDADSVGQSGGFHALTMATAGFSDGDTVRIVVTTNINNNMAFSAGVLAPAGLTALFPSTASGGGIGAACHLVYVAGSSKWAILSSNSLLALA